MNREEEIKKLFLESNAEELEQNEKKQTIVVDAVARSPYTASELRLLAREWELIAKGCEIKSDWWKLTQSPEAAQGYAASLREAATELEALEKKT